MNSPVSKLNERFQEFSRNLEMERAYRHQSIEAQLQSLESKLADQASTNTRLFSDLRDKIIGLRQQVAKLHQTKSNVENSIQQQIVKIEEEFCKQLEGERSQAKQEIEQLSKDADEQLLKICHSVEEVTNEKGETIEALAERMNQKIASLTEKIGNQKRRRETSTNQLTEAIEKEICRLHRELDQNKKMRDSTHNKISKMSKEIENRLQEELSTEREAKKETNQAILMLLEETCRKIERSFC